MLEFSSMKIFLRLVFLLSFSSILTCEKAFTQVSFESEGQLIEQANKLFEASDYVNAMPLFSQLLSLHAKDPNYNYKFGVCVLFNDEDKSKSLSYFDLAIKENVVDKEAFFYAGKGYQMNARFDEALALYEKYKSKISAPDKLDVERYIAQCKNGKNLYDKNVTLQALEKTETLENEFYRNYDLKAMKGRIIPKPLNFKSKKDVKLEDNTLIFVGTENQSIVYSGYNDEGLNTSRELFKVNKLPNGDWGVPVNIGEPINTLYDEEYAFLHPDGKTLYFSSKGHNTMGGYDIFRSVYDAESGKWSAPVNFAHPINSPDDDIFYAADEAGTFAYFASKNFTKPGKIKVYKITTSATAQNNLPVIIKGNFSVNGERVYTKTEIKVTDKTTNTLVGTFNSNRKNGNYLLALPAGKNFVLDITPEDFVSHRVEITIPAKASQEFFEQKINFQKDAVGETVNVTNFFDATGKTAGNNLSSVMLNEQLAEKAKTENKKILSAEEFSAYKTQKAEEEKLHAEAQKKLLAEIESNKQEALLKAEADKKAAEAAKLKAEQDALAKVEAEKKAAEEKVKAEQAAIAKAEADKKAAEEAKQRAAQEKIIAEQLATAEKQKQEQAAVAKAVADKKAAEEAKLTAEKQKADEEAKLVAQAKKEFTKPKDSLSAEQVAAYDKIEKQNAESKRIVEEQLKKENELKEKKLKEDALAQEKFLADKHATEKAQKEKDEQNHKIIEEQKKKEQLAAKEAELKNKAVMDSFALAQKEKEKKFVTWVDSLDKTEAKTEPLNNNKAEEEKLAAEQAQLKIEREKQEALRLEQEKLIASLKEKKRLMEETIRQQANMKRVSDSLAVAENNKEQVNKVADENEKAKVEEAAAKAEEQRKESELKASIEKRKTAEEAKLKAEQEEKRKSEESIAKAAEDEKTAKLKAEQEKQLALEQKKKQEEKKPVVVAEEKSIATAEQSETSEQRKLRLLMQRMNAEAKGREIVENNLKAQQQSGNQTLANSQRYKEVATNKEVIPLHKKEEKLRPPFDKTDLLTNKGVIYKLEVKLDPHQIPQEIASLLKPGNGPSEDAVYYYSGAYTSLAEAVLDQHDLQYKSFPTEIIVYLNGSEVSVSEAKLQPVVE